MLSLSTLQSRLQALEQTIERSTGGVAAPLKPHPLPPLEQAAAATNAGAAPAAAASSHATLLAKLSELTTAFHSVTSQDAAIQSYLAAAPALQSMIDAHPASALTPNIPAALTTREEEVVLSATDMFERTANMLQQTQSLVGVLDQKWPIDGQTRSNNFTALTQRILAIQSSLPRRAFLAAQQHVRFSQFLRSYSELIDLCNRQFVLWNQELDRLEKEVDATLAQQSRT